jgi:glutamate synthase domain-containing protein 3
MRQIMAALGVRKVTDMVGRVDLLETDKAITHWKASGLDLSAILAPAKIIFEGTQVYQTITQDHGLEKALDNQIIELAKDAIETGRKVHINLPVLNINRVVGTMLSNEVAKRWKEEMLPEDTINIKLTGSAGQSLGAWLAKGITIAVEGDANDYVGKGLSGGRVIVYPDAKATFPAEDNIILGNVALYGATSGEAFFRGMAGERFCVRNSGVSTVVEGVGDHGCEYMTGGRVVVLGATGRNFAAGMSGGVAYILDEKGDFATRCNKQMVGLEKPDANDAAELRGLIERHAELTGSLKAKKLLANWDASLAKFVKVMPKDYKRVLQAIATAEAKGLSGDAALNEAFEINSRDTARVGGG